MRMVACIVNCRTRTFCKSVSAESQCTPWPEGRGEGQTTEMYHTVSFW